MRTSLLALVFALAACSNAPTYDRGIAAEDSDLGFAARDALSSGDTRVGHRYVDAFQIDVVAPGRFGVSVSSGAFDGVLDIVSPSGTVRSVSDCEGTSDACSWVDATEAGAWTVRVTSARAGESGGYTFTVSKPLPGPVRAVTDAGAPLALAAEVSEPHTPSPAPHTPLPSPEAGTDATAEQDASGTFTAGTERVRLDGRAHPAVVKALRLLSGDGFFVRYESEDFAPLLVLTRDGEPVEVARLEERTLGGESADLSYWVEETGTYELYFSTTDAELAGDYEYSLWFERDDARIYDRLDLYEYPARPGTSFSDTHTAALRALLDAAPGFGSIRGQRLSGGATGETVYQSTVQIEESVETTVRCRGDRCTALAVFPTPDVSSAGTTGEDLLSYLQDAAGDAFERSVTSADGAMSVEFTSDRVRAEVSFDPTRYDERLGIPVTLRIEGR